MLNANFKRGAVDPIGCMKGGWNLVRNQYWLFVGMSLVVMLINSAVPMGILLGPMMCGLHICLFRKHRNELVDFGTLFKGFDYFGPSLIATLLQVVPTLLIVLPLTAGFFLFPLLLIPFQQNSAASGAVVIVFISLAAILGMLLFLLILLLNVASTFVYPLIVEQKLSGVEAMKLSSRASFANFWRVLGLLLINSIMCLVGLLLCYVGLFLVLPIGFASVSIAYRQVFDPLRSDL